MGSLGCPECGRTPVIYSVSQKMWFCKSCKHSWREEDGKTEPVYWVPEKLPGMKQPASKPAAGKKTARASSSRKKAGPARKVPAAPKKKSKK